VEQHDSIVNQQVIAFSEKRVVVPLADVFEHANGDDAIEFFCDLPIILNAKLAGKPFRSGPRSRDIEGHFGEAARTSSQRSGRGRDGQH
jgi:hypothetical protein